MQLDPDFSEFVALLAAHDVRYMIVGGYALAAHGLPRATGDLDAWIWPDPDNARRVLEVLDEFGFGGLEITEDDLTSPDLVIQLGYPPYRIDLLTRIEGVDFESASTPCAFRSLEGTISSRTSEQSAALRTWPTYCVSPATRPTAPSVSNVVK
jgi:hypothetical protein